MLRRLSVSVALAWTLLAAAPDLARAGEPMVVMAEHQGELFFALDYEPDLAPAPSRRVIIALDTSRSLAGEPFAAVPALVGDLARALERRGVRAQLIHGDLHTARCRGAGAKALSACVRDLEPGGATDLEALLVRAVDLARAKKTSASILLVSDGRPALGARGLHDLTHALAARVGDRDIAIHTVALGDEPDDALLSGLAARFAGVHDTDPDIETLASALAQATLTHVDVRVIHGDVRDLVGRRAGNLPRSPGFALAGKLVSARARVQLRARDRGRVIDRVVDIDPARAPRSPQAVTRWARAAIHELQAMRPVDAARVIEIEERYLPPEPEPEDRVGAVGVLWSTPPQVRLGCVDPVGHRDKASIKRVIRRRGKQLRHCYSDALRRDRRLAGRVRMLFRIAPDGQVTETRVSESQLGSAAAEACLVREFQGMTFPRIEGRVPTTDIHYPILFKQPAKVDETTTLPHWAAAIEAHLAAGRVDLARPYIERRQREIADQGLGDAALLPLLRTAEARAAFAPEFERAARARLALDAVPMDLARAYVAHARRVRPGSHDLAALLRTLDPDIDTGRGLLWDLLQTQAPGDPGFGPRQAEALARSWWWHLGAPRVHAMVRALAPPAPAPGGDQGVPDRDPYDLIAAYQALHLDPPHLPALLWDLAQHRYRQGDAIAPVMDDLVRASRPLGRDRLVLPVVLSRCTTLTDQRAACTRWLVNLSSHAAARRRLAHLYRAVVEDDREDRRQSPEDHYGDLDEAQALAFAGDPGAAARMLSEQLEQDPDDPDATPAFMAGLVALALPAEACAQARRLAARQPGQTAAAVIERAHQDARGAPAPAGFCPKTRR